MANRRLDVKLLLLLVLLSIPVVAFSQDLSMEKGVDGIAASYVTRLRDAYKFFNDNAFELLYPQNFKIRDAVFESLDEEANVVALQLSKADFHLVFETFVHGSTDVAAVDKYYRKVPSDVSAKLNESNPSDLLWIINRRVRSLNERLQKESALSHPAYKYSKKRIFEIFAGDPRLASAELDGKFPENQQGWRLREVSMRFLDESIRWQKLNPNARGKVTFDAIKTIEEKVIDWGEQQGYLPPAVILKAKGDKAYSVDGGKTWRSFPIGN